MEDLSYSYILGVPVTIMNVVWVAITTLLMASYFSNHILKPGGATGSIFKYFIEYGKSQSIRAGFDFPKRYFTHYYVLATLWNGACCFTIVALCYGRLDNNWVANSFMLHESDQPKGDQLSVIMVIIMITLHSAKRLYECLFVSVFSSNARINAIHYIWGFTYYLLLAPTLISECLPLNKLPFGSIQLRHVIGIAGFIVASFIHHQSHLILANLRKTGRVKQESHGLPQGGLFGFVSCPHYFAEVLIYVFTLVIVRSQCVSWWVVLVYNIVVHVNMAKTAHVWYQQNFPNYPPSKKAFIPFLF
ncbi:unnamed protein product [Clavelina lepadiformis]|uniref:Polyprenal reductase n=1 Tax=Clavelina lepadiformis TaxID=159417 RepID=A0ABP0FY76_CLALP